MSTVHRDPADTVPPEVDGEPLSDLEQLYAWLEEDQDD